MAELTVLYDEGCGFCTRVALQVARPPRVDVAPIGSPLGSLLLRDLTPLERYATMHVVDATGRRRSGGSALAPLARTIPRRRGSRHRLRRVPRAGRCCVRSRRPEPRARLEAAAGLRPATLFCLGDLVTLTLQPPARHLLRAKDLIDARYREPLDVPDARARRAPLHRALQPRVPQGVRRDAAPVPAHTPARARRRAAAEHRPDRVRDLLHGGLAERRARSRRASGAPSDARRSPTAPPIHRQPTGCESRRAC